MPQRLAGAMSLLVFAFCLLVGAFGANNTFSTAVYRALIAMAGTYVIVYVLGMMAKRMIEENVAASAVAKNEIAADSQVSEAKSPPRDR